MIFTLGKINCLQTGHLELHNRSQKYIANYDEIILVGVGPSELVARQYLIVVAVACDERTFDKSGQGACRFSGYFAATLMKLN